MKRAIPLTGYATFAMSLSLRSSTSRSLVRMYGNALRFARLASISPLTSAALRDLGHEPAGEASPHTTAGLIDVILRDGQAAG